MFCKLRKQVIDRGECYDIQMVRGGYIKPEILEYPLDRDEAGRICPTCRFCQLRSFRSDVLDLITKKLKLRCEVSSEKISLFFHDDFTLEYDWRNVYINGRYFYDVEEQDFAAWIEGITEGMVFVQYRRKRFFRLTYFKEFEKAVFHMPHRIPKSVEKIFTDKETLCRCGISDRRTR